VLDDWQRFALDCALGERADGKWAAFEVGIVVPRQNGKGAILEARELAGLFLFDEQLILHSAHEFKALDVHTPILTPRGWSTMGDLVDGDEVFAPDGQPTKVIAAHPVRTGRPCYRMRFDDGQEVVCDADHLWDVFDVTERRRRVISTREMLDAGVSTVVPRSARPRRTYRFRVDVPAPISGSDAALPIDPWLLGAWLGDGTSGKGELTVGAEDLSYVLARLDALGEDYRLRPDKRNPTVLTVIIPGLVARLRALDVLGRKRIPDLYLTASERQRWDLLAGLMDTDGTVCAHRVNLTMIKRDLMEDSLCLVRSLGYKATLREFRARLNGQDAGAMFRIAFTSSNASPFQMPRKTAKMKPRESGVTRAHYNAVVAIESVESRPTRCITVAHESSCYLVGRGFVPTHNTAAEAFRRVLALVEASDDLRKRVRKVRTSHGEEGIETTSGQRLRFVARSTGSGRGFSGDCVILDEAYRLPQEALGALLPTLSARPNPQLWYTSSAGHVDSDVLRSVRDRGIGKDPNLAYLEWSADPALQADDRAGWRAANPAIGIRIEEEHVARELAAMPAEEFARERLGIWSDPGAADTALSMPSWESCVDLSSSALDPVAIGVDVSPDGAGAIAVAGQRQDGLLHVEVLDHQPGTSWVVERVQALVRRWSPSCVVLDVGSPAGALLPDLERAGVVVRKVAGREMAQAAVALAAHIDQTTLRHRQQPDLDAAVAGARRRVVGDLWAFGRRGSFADISPLVAVALASWGHSQTAGREPSITDIWSLDDEVDA